MAKRVTLDIQILSRKLIKPSAATPPHLRNYKLSLFDQLAPPGFVNLILYYATAPIDISLLEKSLSETLSRFYPFAGRYIKDGFFVDCSDQGVEFLETHVVGSILSDFLSSSEIEPLNLFMPWDIGPAESVTSPMLVIQINQFDCGGIAIGFRFSHVIADAFTISLFLNSWAKVNIAENGEMISPKFGVFSSLFRTRTLSGVDHPHLVSTTSTPKYLTKKFAFDEAAISALKAGFHGGISRVTVATAVIWKALIEIAAKAKSAFLRDSILATSMSLRGKTAVPIPENSFGNFWMSTSVRFPAEGKRNTQLEWHELAKLIGNSLRGVAAECGKIIEVDDLASMVIGSYTEILEQQLKVEEEEEDLDVYIFTSWCKFPLYEADFGWGKPCWVSRVSRAFQVINLIDNKEGNGIEAWVSLKEIDMLEFLQDPDIMAFTA